MTNDLTELARQAVFDELNKGQTQKILKNPTIAKLVEKYGVSHK